MSGIPGVAGLGAVAGRTHHGEFAHGELAEHSCTCVAEAFGDGGVGVRDAVVEAEAAVSRADALCVAEVLEGDGDAVEGAAGVACSEFSVGVLGLLERVVGGWGEKGVEGVVKCVYSIDMGLGQLDGG